MCKKVFWEVVVICGMIANGVFLVWCLTLLPTGY